MSLILDQLLYNQTVKNIANKILGWRWVVTNPIYKFVYKKRINEVIRLYENKPFSLRIENTNYCNARCFMCPHSCMKRKQGTMEFKSYKKIIDQAVELGIEFINLHNFGEPLIDKGFIEKVKYAKNKGIKRIGTNTNGMLLTKDLNKEIIMSGLDEIYISLDAIYEQTYKKIRIGLDFQTIKKNVLDLVSIKQKMKSKTPKIIVDFLETDLNKKEKKEFVKFWQRRVNSVCVSQIHDWSSKKDLDLKTKFNYVEYSQAPCRLPFNEMTINWDGTVVLCCQDIENEQIMGNVNNESIEKIWRNKKYKKVRRAHMRLQTEELDLCKNCKLRTFWWTY